MGKSSLTFEKIRDTYAKMFTDSILYGTSFTKICWEDKVPKNFLDVDVEEVENGYVIEENTPSYEESRRWVARDTIELGKIMQELAEEKITKRNDEEARQKAMAEAREALKEAEKK